jgi:hypothetical protein
MIRRRKGSVEVHVHEFLTTILRWIKRSVSSFTAFTSWKNPVLIKYVAALDVTVKRKILSLPKNLLEQLTFVQILKKFLRILLRFIAMFTEPTIGFSPAPDE